MLPPFSLSLAPVDTDSEFVELDVMKFGIVKPTPRAVSIIPTFDNEKATLSRSIMPRVAGMSLFT